MKPLLLLLLGWMCLSCSFEQSRGKLFDADPAGIPQEERFEFHCQIRDTSRYALEVLLFVTEKYPYENFVSQLQWTSPNGAVLVDTISFAVRSQSDPVGNLTKMRTVRREVLNDVRFEEMGHYCVSLRQIMSPRLTGVSAVGIYLKKK